MGREKMENLSVIGIGRLGLCFSMTLENAGYNVVGCDINEKYVNEVNSKTFKSSEPGLSSLLRKSENFKATTSLYDAVNHSKLVFVLVRTESEPDGKYDHSQVESVLTGIQKLGVQEETKHLVICSNVNPGYSNQIAQRLEELNWAVSYNPEMIAQGTILKNQQQPDCVYIGAASTEATNEIEKIYNNICSNKPKIYRMDRNSAELAKVSLNSFLTVKISFANMVGDLAIKMNADPDKVLEAIGGDSRIGDKFFKYGFGWGGPCFPRDTRAFVRNAEQNEINAYLVKAASNGNKEHLNFQINQFINTHDKDDPVIFDGTGHQLASDTVFEGVTYKKGTTIIEESQQLEFAVQLAKLGYDILVIDSPQTIKQVQEVYGDIFSYEEVF